MRVPRFSMLLLVPALWAAPALVAQEDVEGSQDHALVSRMPDHYIESWEQLEFDTIEVETGPDSMRELEGKVTTIRYTVKEGARAPTALQVERNYRNALKTAGAKILYEEDDRITAQLERGGAEVWTAIRAYGGHYVVRIVEIGEMAQEVTASNILAELDRAGRVALYVSFDTGQATIRRESAAVLDEVAAALRESATLRVAIEGHTDDVGSADSNQMLSERRAGAVVAALESRGIEPSRLSSSGFGETKPIADNRTEEGRAKNRRVELVKS